MAATIGTYALSTEDVNGVSPGKKKSNKTIAEQRSDERAQISHTHTNQHGHDTDQDACNRDKR